MKKFLSVLAVTLMLGATLAFAEDAAAPAPTPMAKKVSMHKKGTHKAAHKAMHKKAEKKEAPASETPVAK